MSSLSIRLARDTRGRYRCESRVPVRLRNRKQSLRASRGGGLVEQAGATCPAYPAGRRQRKCEEDDQNTQMAGLIAVARISEQSALRRSLCECAHDLSSNAGPASEVRDTEDTKASRPSD